jgi:hypothetical protein
MNVRRLVKPPGVVARSGDRTASHVWSIAEMVTTLDDDEKPA